MSDHVHELMITGMTCGGCSGRVTKVLESTAGVLSAEVSLNPGSAQIQTDGSIPIEKLVETVEAAGFDAMAT
jgi:copper chaperone CopZ